MERLNLFPRIVTTLATNTLRRLTSQRQTGRSTSEVRDLEPGFVVLHAQCSAFSMTSLERMYALYKAVDYVITNDIPGDFVECGVWRGGSAMLMASALKEAAHTDRHLWLYDTFSGMTEPTERDVSPAGDHARSRFDRQQRHGYNAWCYAPLDEVSANLLNTGYPPELLHFVCGRVEDTLPALGPEKIALLRLDTDWYESTRHELEHLYPRLARRGVLILDDYGHWHGARDATDEYMRSLAERPFLCRVDYTGRIAVKP